MIRYLNYLIVVVFILALTGCYGAGAMIGSMVAAYAPHIAGAAIDAEKGKYKDIELAMRKGMDKSKLDKFNRVSFLVGTNNQQYFSPGIGGLFSDNLSKEFIKMGAEVIERDSIEDVISEMEFQRGKFSSNKNLARIGKVVGVRGIFKGFVQTGHSYNMGFMGFGAGIQQGILGASLKLIDVETTRVVLVITATFKKPKDAAEVARDIAHAFFMLRSSRAEAEEDESSKIGTRDGY